MLNLHFFNLEVFATSSIISIDGGFLKTKQKHFNFRFHLYPSVVCCCKLNNSRDCDEHLFGQVSMRTGRY